MKKKYYIILLLITIINSYCQQIGIPYRVGNKFGVADTNGKIIIPAIYDIVEPETYNDYNYFVAYRFEENAILSSLIYKNKVLINDKNYSNYYINNGLIKAKAYKLLKEPSYFAKDDHSEIEHLFDLKGNKIFQGDFKSIAIVDDIDDTNKINVFLIYTHDMNDFESLYLFDKKANKITKTFIEKAKPIRVNYDYSDDYRNRTITNIYIDKKGVGKKMVLKIQNNTIVVGSETSINFPDEKNRMESRDYNDIMIEAPQEERPKIPLNSAEEKMILTVRKLERKRGFYYLPKKIEELRIVNFNLRKDEQFIVSKNNKQGLYSVYYNTYTVPIQYDEILFADFEGRNGGYILRNDAKYGIFIYDHPNHKVIEPIFDMMPLLVNYNYFGEKKPLFKLYDEEGKLFCYANEKGVLFYKP
jgi:hypothetical protein